MYTPVGIEELSKAQIKKLLMGGRVRVKAGGALKVSMVQEHAKKLASAAKKGSGMMIQLDPYACDLNREELEGCGINKKLKTGFKKLGSFVKGNKEAFRPLATSLKQAGRDAIADATMSALDYGIDPAMVAAYSQLAQEAIPTGVQGGSMKSFAKGVTKFVRGPAAKTVRKAFRPLAQKAFEDAQDIAFQGLDMASQQALGSMSGQGIKSFSKGLTKFVQGPAAKTVRKAFRPLAQKAFEDAQNAAFQGLDMASQQALGSMSAPTGMGMARQIARARAGGALFPAGMGYL